MTATPRRPRCLPLPVITRFSKTNVTFIDAARLAEQGLRSSARLPR